MHTSVQSHESSFRCIDEITLVNVLSEDGKEGPVLLLGCEFVSRPPTCHITQNTCQFMLYNLLYEQSTLALLAIMSFNSDMDLSRNQIPVAQISPQANECIYACFTFDVLMPDFQLNLNWPPFKSLFHLCWKLTSGHKWHAFYVIYYSYHPPKNAEEMKKKCTNANQWNHPPLGC